MAVTLIDLKWRRQTSEDDGDDRRWHQQTVVGQLRGPIDH